tara:strand:- start:260 stop:442 length:183 start_codon:yes stop_codon:yes gene_type:complete
MSEALAVDRVVVVAILQEVQALTQETHPQLLHLKVTMVEPQLMVRPIMGLVVEEELQQLV